MLSAFHVLNRVGNAKNKLTPYQLVYDKVPSVKHFRVFGSYGFALQTLKQAKKFQKNSVEVQLLGYAVAHKAYYVRYVASNKLGIERT